MKKQICFRYEFVKSCLINQSGFVKRHDRYFQMSDLGSVAQMLKAKDRRLYFYTVPETEDKKDRMEIDFLIAKSKITSRHNICPIEVKSGRRKFTTSSLEKFNSKFHEQLHTSMVLHDGDVQQKDGFIYLPLYMTPLL